MSGTGPDGASRLGTTAASTYPVTGAWCQFEESLQAALVTQPKKKRDWAWLNASFTLWLASALFLGLGGYVYTALPSCISSVQLDSRQGSKLLFEIAERRRALTALSSMSDTLDELNRAVRVADPAQTYTFSELQGKEFTELMFELETIFYRWKIIPHRSSTTAKGLPVDSKHDPKNPPTEFSMSDPYWVLAYLSLAALTNQDSPHDLHDETRSFLAGHWKMTNDEREAAIKDKAGRFRSSAERFGPRPDLDRFGDLSDTSALISEWKCAQRLVWPFW